MNQNNLPTQNHPSSPDSFAIASLVLGAVAFVLFWIPGFNVLTLACGIVGICLAVKSRKTAVTDMSTGGLILSIAGTALSVIAIFACTVCALCAVSLYSTPEFSDAINEISSYDWTQFT